MKLWKIKRFFRRFAFCVVYLYREVKSRGFDMLNVNYQLRDKSTGFWESVPFWKFYFVTCKQLWSVIN